MTHFETAAEVIRQARKHLGGEMESSARLCLADAIALYDADEMDAAKERALKSLAYSVGVFHPVYVRSA
jgi:hypothetical protein